MIPGRQPTITLDEAKHRAHAYFDDIVRALPVTPRLEEVGSPTSIECTDPTDNGPRGRYDYGFAYFLDGIPTERNPEIYQVFRTYLTGRGFVPYADDPGFLGMESTRDGFRAVLEQSIDASQSLSLTISAPCVWPNGTP